jgi:hypothetical protein
MLAIPMAAILHRSKTADLVGDLLFQHLRTYGYWPNNRPCRCPSNSVATTDIVLKLTAEIVGEVGAGGCSPRSPIRSRARGPKAMFSVIQKYFSNTIRVQALQRTWPRFRLMSSFGDSTRTSTLGRLP